MNFFNHITIIILLSFLFKWLSNYIIEKSNYYNSLRKDYIVAYGFPSIRDFSPNQISLFKNLLLKYLNLNSFSNLKEINNNFPSFTGMKNGNFVYISSYLIENKSDKECDLDRLPTVGRPTIQVYLSDLISSGAQLGYFYSNSSFSEECMEYVDKINRNTTDLHINLIEGYKISTTLRRDSETRLKRGGIYEI